MVSNEILRNLTGEEQEQYIFFLNWINEFNVCKYFDIHFIPDKEYLLNLVIYNYSFILKKSLLVEKSTKLTNTLYKRSKAF